MSISKEIKKTKNLSIKTYFLSSFLISNRISPYISSFYIKKKVIPNRITLHMILSGIIGAIFFSMPNVILKIIGAIFVHLWFILDCSDGEVARYTKKYSKYGKELDYMAHLIDHPLFGFALFISLYQLERYNFNILLILVVLSNFLDYFNRNIILLENIIDLKESKENKGNIVIHTKWTLKELVIFIIKIFTIYPNIVLFGVLVYFIDYFLRTNILFYYISTNAILSGILSIKAAFSFTRKFYNSY